MSRAERVIVVSLQKSGTHLIQEIMRSLGYGIYGSSRIGPQMRPSFSREDRLAIARFVMEPSEVACLGALSDEDFITATDRAWEEVGWAWQKRLGVPVFNRYGNAHQAWIGDIASRKGLDHMRFADTPPNVCWIVHDLDVRTVDGDFLSEWSESGEPRIILNYRDPRDVMLSFVNYLSGGTGRGFGIFHEFKVFSQILEGMTTLEEKLTYALADKSFPGQGALEKAFWLYRHPKVCCVSFEELVGVQGGGREYLQHAAVGRILRHLSLPSDAGEIQRVAQAAFNKNAFTFFRGQIGAWRSHYTQEHRRLFERSFGQVAAMFGYANGPELESSIQEGKTYG